MPLDVAQAPRASIRFLVGGRVVAVDDVPPTRTVLEFLRQDLGRTGTKEGCAEGDCGACTVVVAGLADGDVEFRTLNACIQFVPALDGKALFTVEDLREANGALHPAQQAMVACHGSQCGFCTPGFVMSLWALYLEHEAKGTRASAGATRTALTGNLCRCTGYRPILEAGARMFDAAPVHLDRAALKRQLESIARTSSLAYAHEGQRYFAPATLAELTELRAAHPDATILAGGTDVGLWVTKQLRELPTLIAIGQVAELEEVRTDLDMLRIGAGVSLNDAFHALVAHYPELIEMWERFASVPIRNAGTLGGNVANGSPIGDSMPALIALGACVELASRGGSRILPMEDLYVGYMKQAMAADEVLVAVLVPLPHPGLVFRTYKLAKRYDSDISAVCAAFALDLDHDRIAACRVAFGGMAATAKRAPAVEAALTGRRWTEEIVRDAMAALATDYRPLTDMRASAAYRLRGAQNLLYRYFLETRPDHALPADRVSVFAAT